MKIICHSKDKAYTITCNNCNSDLGYTENDVFYIKEERRGGITRTVSHLFRKDEHYTNVYTQEYRCVKCPVCGNVIKRIDFSNGLPKLDVRWEKQR